MSDVVPAIERLPYEVTPLNVLPEHVGISVVRTAVEIRSDLGLPEGTAQLECRPPEHFNASLVRNRLRVSSKPNNNGGEIVLCLGPGATLPGDCSVKTTDANIDVVGTPDTPMHFGGMLTLRARWEPGTLPDGVRPTINVGRVVVDGALRTEAPFVQKLPPITAGNYVMRERNS